MLFYNIQFSQFMSNTNATLNISFDSPLYYYHILHTDNLTFVHQQDKF